MTLSAVAVLLHPCPAVAQDPFYDRPPVLSPGDLIQINVWRQPEFSGEFEVTGGGTLTHPLYSEIQVANREVGDVENQLRALLQGYVEEPSFVVEGFFRIAVGGEVRQPDIYTLRPETSIARAIALAGGPTERGDLERVILRRNNEAYTLNIVDPGLRLRDVQVRSGDEIAVQRRVSAFRDYIVPWASVTGAVAAIIRLFR